MSIIETSNRVEQLTLEQQQQQQLEDAVDQAPAVYATAQQALYDHQQHRQTLIDVYLIEVKRMRSEQSIDFTRLCKTISTACSLIG